MKIKGMAVRNGTVERDSVIEVENGRIKAVLPAGEHSGIDYDFSGCYVGPGFIDLHFHGANGVGFSTGGEEDIVSILRHCAAHGTTSVLASLYAAPPKETESALAVIARYMAAAKKENLARPGILGVHLEGPFISPNRIGCMNPAMAVPPSLELYKRWETLADIKLITVAPELEGAKELLEYASSHGAVAAAGHSTAGYDLIYGSADWGVTHLTHCYNAMTGLGHRDPGAVGAGLFHPAVSIELITDFIHIHPKMLELAWRIKGMDGVCLVTDSVEQAGLPDGEYTDDHGDKRWVRAGKITTGDGTIAGSAHTLDAAVRNTVSLGVSIWDAWRMTSYNPAKKLGMEKELGSLEPGMRADFAVLNSDFKCEATFVGGQKA